MPSHDAANRQECVCGEINTRHCPVHGQGEVESAASVVVPTPRPPLKDPTYTVICDECCFYALCWSPERDGTRLDACPSCGGRATYGAFTFMEEPANV